MIAETQYLCANTNEAVLFCIEPGCQHYAPICDSKTCSCKAPHSEHQKSDIEWVLKKALQPTPLPKELAALEKSIDILIDGLVRDAEQLRARHRQHINQQAQQRTGGSTLRRCLAGREQLERREATGDGFHRLLQELSSTGPTESPYRLPAAELERVVAAARKDTDGLLARVEQLWQGPRPPTTKPQEEEQAPKFRFSEALKHKDITLSEAGGRAA